MSQAFIGVAILFLPLVNPDTFLLQGTWELVSERTIYVNGYSQDRLVPDQSLLVFDGKLMTSDQGGGTEEAGYAALAIPSRPGATMKLGYIFKAGEKGEPWRYTIAGDALTIRVLTEVGFPNLWKDRIYKRVVFKRE